MQVTTKYACLMGFLCLAIPAKAVAGDRPILDLSQIEVKIGVSLVTEHVGAKRDFNETNPGAFVNVWRAKGFLSGDIGMEAGLFENSFSELSTTINGWAEWPVLGNPEATFGQLNIGAALGIARYPNLVDEAQDLGLPTLGNFVPFAAAQLTWLATERFELRARATPIGGDADFVVGLQMFLRL